MEKNESTPTYVSLSFAIMYSPRKN